MIGEEKDCFDDLVPDFDEESLTREIEEAEDLIEGMEQGSTEAQ